MAAAGTARQRIEDAMAQGETFSRRSTDAVNVFGAKPAECAIASICQEYRSPTPMQDRVHAVFSRSQRRTTWALIILSGSLLAALLVFTGRAFASAPIQRQDNSAQIEHQAEQDRRLDWSSARVDRDEQRLTELEQQVNRMIGFGGGLGCLAIFLQLVQLLNQRNTANQVLRVVQEKEAKSAAGGK